MAYKVSINENRAPIAVIIVHEPKPQILEGGTTKRDKGYHTFSESPESQLSNEV